jgi:ABC-type transport system substrate-binding protein
MRVLALVLLVAVAGCGPAAQAPSLAPTTAPAAPTEAAPIAATVAPVVPTAAPTPAVALGGSVTRAITAEPTSLDPHAAPGSGQNVILPYIFDTLVFRDMDNTYQPYLATGWEIAPDGKSITFTLRDDVTFHDGTPLNAEAVVFTFKRFKEARTSVGEGLASMTGVEALDKVIPDASTQLAALQAGEVDLIFVNAPDHIEKLKADPSVELIETRLNSLIYLGFNCAKAPLDEVKVRQALSHAVNKEEILAAALGGTGQVAFAPMAPTLPGFDPSLQQYELGYDPARASALLAKAGFAPGADGTLARNGQPLNLTLLTFARAPNEDVATLLQSQLKAIGVNATIQQFDTPTAAKAATEGQYDLLLWRYDRNDADVLNINLHSSRIGSSNRFGYSNPEVDALLDQAARELDETARAGYYVAAQKLIMADAPWQPLYVPVDVLAINKRIQNYHLASMGRILLNEAHVMTQ